MKGRFRALYLRASAAILALGIAACSSGLGDVGESDIASTRQAQVPGCPNGVIDPNETCDDGNANPGDGCSPTCQTETGWDCSGTPSTCTAKVPAQCGNGIVESGEQCDPPGGDGGANPCACQPGCTFASSTTVCRVASCSNGTATDEATCTGTDTICPAVATTPCDPYACDTTTCKSTCLTPGDCAPGNTCNQGACVPSGPSCGNGIVEPGEQCEPSAASTGPCACQLDCAYPIDGTSCGAAPTSSCDVVDQCDGAGNCVQRVAIGGTTCRPAVGECDVAETCDGVTNACPPDSSREGQACGPVPTGDCDLPDTCIGSVGASATCKANFKDGTTSCRAASCSGGFETIPASCTGSSTECPSLVQQACAPYACGPSACRTSCAGPADCAPDHECQGTSCVPTPGALILMPSTASVPPRGSVSFSANGGTAPYAFDLAANGSNGIVGAGGAYVAGPKGSVTDTVRVTDSGGKTQTALVQVGPEISIAPASGTIALGGTQDFTATGGNDGPYSWNASAGTIDGAGHFTAPNVSGSVTIGASDSLGNTAFVVFAVGTGLAIVKTPAQSFPKGTVLFTASGGSQTGFTWSLVTAPAAGGSIDSATGQFTAGPTANVTETIKVTDSVGGSATTTLDIGPGLSLTPASATATPGQHISFAASGGSGVGISFALEASPSGGTLDGTGVYIAGTISGTDVVKVVDSVGNVARANVTVNGAPPPLDAGIGDDAGTIADAGAHPDAATTTTPPPVPPGAGTTPPGANPTKPGAIDIGPPGTGGGEDCTMHGAPRGSSGAGGFFLMALAALGRRRRHRR